MKIFHHNDMDGKGAASICILANKKKNIKGFEGEYLDIVKNNCIELDHNYDSDRKKLLSTEAGETIYILDYAFSAETMDILDILNDRGCTIYWIDHHATSLDMINRIKVNYKGIVNKTYSGALLTYMYFYDITFLQVEDRVPLYVRYISDYDCWHNKMQPNTDYFKLGYDGHNNIWILLYDLWTESAKDSNIHRTMKNVLHDTIEVGKSIKTFVDNENKFYREKYGFESKLEDGTPCYVVNKDTNSWIFGEMYDKFPCVINYAFDGKEYVYSIYSKPELGFNCKEYAEKHGGGGHVGASGFRSKELLYKAVN